AEEYLSVHTARDLAREVDDHRGHVVGVELLDLGDTAVLAFDALLPAQLPGPAHLLVDGHARPGHRRDRVHRDAVLPEVAGRDLGEAADGRFGGSVVRLARIAEQPRARGEGDDPAVGLLPPGDAGRADG